MKILHESEKSMTTGWTVALAAAEAANNSDYVKMNKDSIMEWSRK